ncbi:collagen-binding domain-containing protein [Weissella ceti]|uniref:collagen-binding domain-containing protein n=1 Tax=Weissella ceti TaxID=759620 RepID=UPI001BCAD045|nr:collagen-binding domain-containing protein [Weissella ceti]QVK11997.1 choice-of-anchor A family protein [Weissella ceti]
MNRILLFSVVLGTTVAPTAAQVSANQVTEQKVNAYYPGYPNHNQNQHHNHNNDQGHKPSTNLTVKDVSRNARDYNAIIFGNHTVSKADIEGATIVQGNVFLKPDRPGQQPHFDYGASGSGAANLIGDKGLKPNVPSLILGQGVSGPFGKVRVLGQNVGVRASIRDISTFDADVKRVDFTDKQMDAFMASIHSQMRVRFDKLNGFANSVKPTGKEFKIQPVPGNPRIGVVSLSADSIKVSEMQLPALNQYDRIIVKIKARSVSFANGSILKADRTLLDVNQPVGTPENNLMRQYASKLTWIMDDTTKNVSINGFGVVGDFYAPYSNLDGNGGNINGQLFINSLVQRGGFEVHNLPEGARNDKNGVPPLESLELKPNKPLEGQVEKDESESFEDLDKLPPFKPEDGKVNETKEPELEKPVEPTDKPEVHIKPHQPKEEIVPDESETIEDLEVVPPFKPEDGKADKTEEPKLEKPVKPTDKPDVHIKPHEPKEEVVPDESETIEDLETVPPFNPGAGKATEGEEPKLEDILKPTDKPEVEIGPHFPTDEVVTDDSESTDDLPILPPFIPQGDKATEGETPKLEDIIKPTDKPKVEIAPNESKEEKLEDESETTDELPPFIPQGDKATEGETPKLEDGIKPTDKPKLEIAPNESKEEVLEDESETTDELPPFIPQGDKATEGETPKLEDIIKPTDKPKVEIAPNESKEEVLEDESETTDELPPFIPQGDKATEGETPKLEDIIKPTDKPKVEIVPNESKEEKLEDELETTDELPPFIPQGDKATEGETPKLEDIIKPTDKPKVEIAPNESKEEKLEDESETTDELPPFIPQGDKATEGETPKLEDGIKPTDKPKVEIAPNESKEEKLEDESETTDELPPFIPQGDKATEGETPKLEDGIKPTDKPEVQIEPNQPKEEKLEDESESIDDLPILPPFIPGEGKAKETQEPKLEDPIKPTDKPLVIEDPKVVPPVKEDKKTGDKPSKPKRNNTPKPMPAPKSKVKEVEKAKQTKYKQLKPAEKDAVAEHEDTNVSDVNSMLTKRLNESQTTLPNTGERPVNSIFTVLGLALLSVVASLIARKSRKN